MIYLKQWQRTGIMYINDLLDENFNFLSHDKFQRIFQLHVPFTAYYGLISAIPPSWRRTIRRTEITIENVNASQEPPLSKNFTTCAVYAAIIDHYFQPLTAEPKLLQYGFSKEYLKKVYNLPFVTTFETKLQIFQYKIIHNILPTRHSLFRMKLCDSEICQLCKMQPQTLLHLFYLCSVISNFWSAFQTWWFERNILFGWHDNTTESKDILNYVTLVATYYIFCTIQDSDDVPFDGFPSLLKNKLNTSQQIAVKNKTSDNFNKKWKDFIGVFFHFT